jgi:hypothetical protein
MKVDEVEEYNNLGNLQQHLMAFYAFLVLCTNVDEVELHIKLGSLQWPLHPMLNFVNFC